ncbi:cell division ATP-binding protein FtsE [Xylocopilactobacillus apicola]|uniref:Cell division ATP-binding protein FtsE n=1 Tax=Xylocopilactobacillus apicola TaxID=2932184 RepID=A0AAU9DDQ4_9LACO|nr:cell division ATP-binding protein FtsE [Xylocopilactobacillus apicola]BDR57945.1 cell division ATP-binding protein FtsE [Xylocopilactobacillus apicola]
MIELKNVIKKYPNGIVALKGIDLKIEQGEFAYIVGPSGSGKSTLIKTLYREERVTSGIIKVNEYDLMRMTHKQVPYLRRELGIVFQDFRLLPRLTAYENVAYAMEVIEKRPEEIKSRVMEVLEMVGLKDKIRRYPNELSGGEQQRVAIARAITNKPSILIADEPTGNLDPDTSNEIMDIIERINQQNTTVIMATHNQSIVNQYVHRVLTIQQGRLVSDQEEGGYRYED